MICEVGYVAWNYVCLYASYLESLSPFSDAEIGRMVIAMLTYSATGEEPKFDGNERFMWPTLKTQIDRDEAAYRERCEKNRANGAKGGRPTKNPTVIPETERFSEKPKKAKEKKKEKEKESIEADKPPARKRFTAPTVQEVTNYCRDKGYSIDAERFVDYYESVGWKVGKNQMKDWKAAVRTWAAKEKPVQPSTTPEHCGYVLAPLEDPYEAAMRGA